MLVLFMLLLDIDVFVMPLPIVSLSDVVLSAYISLLT